MDLGSGRETGDQLHAHHHSHPQSHPQPHYAHPHPHPHPHPQQPQQPQPLPVTPISLLLPSPQLLQQAASNSFHATPVLPSHHDTPKLKLVNTPTGNGGSQLSQKVDHHVGADQGREIVRQAVVAVTEAGLAKKQQQQQQQQSSVKKGTVRYRECQKNHAASIGGHAIDGCGEFMPGGEDGSVDALRCAACDCHRNFHRREVEGEVVCDCKKPKPKLPASVVSTPQPSPAPGTTATATTTSTIALPSSQLGQMAPLTMAALSAGGGPTDSDEPDDGPAAGHLMMSMRSPSTMKKRFRTKFSTEQKDQMCAFAEKVGWRIQKHDEAAVQEFCATVGVKRHVLKVWMHNNKHTVGKKP